MGTRTNDPNFNDHNSGRKTWELEQMTPILTTITLGEKHGN